MVHAHLCRFQFVYLPLHVRKPVSAATARHICCRHQRLQCCIRHQLQLAADGLHVRVQIEKDWSAKAERPFDPYLTTQGEQQAKAVAAELKKFDLQRVYVSPFLRLAVSGTLLISTCTHGRET